MDHELVCQRCGAQHEPGSYPFGCPTCLETDQAGRLEVVLTDRERVDFPPGDDAESTMWRYRELLPLLADDPVTLGEGWTPLVELSTGAPYTHHLKNETVNPTWSYKDRLNSLLLSNITALGHAHVVTSSTGNHGASTAAYATHAGVEQTVVLLHPESDRPHQVQLQAYGAKVAVASDEGRSTLLRALAERGWFPTVNVTEPFSGVPYTLEGYKTVAYELVEQLGESPTFMVCAIGAGDGLYGVWKGFRELADLDVIEHTPRMVGVQPAERPSVVKAFEAGADRVETTPGPMPIATSTSGPSAGDHTLRALRESDGIALGIDRSSIRDAITETGRSGVFLEPASAMTVAAVEVLAERGEFDRDDHVVSLGTGAGVKWPSKTGELIGEVPHVGDTLDELVETLDIDPDAPGRERPTERINR